MTKPVCNYGNDNCDVVSHYVKEAARHGITLDENSRRIICHAVEVGKTGFGGDEERRKHDDAALRDLFAAHMIGNVMQDVDNLFSDNKEEWEGKGIWQERVCRNVWAWADAMLRTREGGA